MKGLELLSRSAQIVEARLVQDAEVFGVSVAGADSNGVGTRLGGTKAVPGFSS